MRLRVLAGAALLSGVVATASGCGGTKQVAGSPFDDQGSHPVACMTHQPAPPAGVDQPGAAADTESVLDYLHYYTVNGNKPYCDGHAATSIDRQWLSLYLAGGAQRSNIVRALSTSG
jgi:hypothetical protein